MLCYRAVDTTADEEGGGGSEKYEIKTLRKETVVDIQKGAR